MYPDFSNDFNGLSIEKCSICVVIIWFPLFLWDDKIPFMAKLLASVPLEVNVISLGFALTRLATCPRATCIASLATLPNWCKLEGLPKHSFKKGVITSTITGCTGLPEALSIYIFVMKYFPTQSGKN